MNQHIKTFLLLIAFSVVCFTSVFAVEYSKKKELPPVTAASTNRTPTLIQNTVTAANPPLPQGNPVNQGTVTPDVPRQLCPAFVEYKNEPHDIQAVNRPGGRTMCPPGYHCTGTLQFAACLIRCVKTNQTQMFADDSACKWTECNANACSPA